MSQQFLMKLVNPALTNPPNEIFMHQPGGNKLDVILTNSSGFDTSFSASNGGELRVKFPVAILDIAAAKRITAAKPWTLASVDAPSSGADKGYVVLQLNPGDGDGIEFKGATPVVVSLAEIAPIAKGNAAVFAAYDFVDLDQSMNANDQLAVIGLPSPNDQPLIGDGNALRLSVTVNSGPATNPIVATPAPVTSQNAAENRIHLNFDFQDQNLPTGAQSNAELGRLVPKWDPLKPPTFRLQFPYYTGDGVFAAPQDLTDANAKGDPNYNKYTSAWNIKLSLSSTDPNNTQNDWWTIQLDPLSLTPSWLIQPTNKNLYLFTGTTQGPNAPGPFLDLFFSHIYTDLPIDSNKPETILYLETYDFPGFGDRMQQQPIFKEPSVQISSFDGSISIQGGVTILKLNWTTSKNCDYCLVSGDANRQAPYSAGSYARMIDIANPLRSSYTLTAIGKDGVSQLQRTVYVRWTQKSGSSSASFQNPTAIALSPDGEAIYVVGDNALNVLASSTLLSKGNPLTLSDGAILNNVVASPDGANLFLAAAATDGSTGWILPYTSTLQRNNNISAAQPGMNVSPNLYPMAISEDGSQLAITMPYPFDGGAQPSIGGYSTADLSSSPAGVSPLNVPTLRQIGVAINGGNLYYPDKAGLGVLDRTTFQPRAGSPVSLKSGDDVSYTPGPLAVSPDGTRVATLARGLINNARAFILCLVDVQSMKLLKRVQVGVGYLDAPPVTATGMSYSLDGAYLFVFGGDYSSDPPKQDSTLMCVYDAETLQQFEWSPIAVDKFFGNFVMAPHGARFYVSTYDTGQGTSGKVIELIPHIPSAT